MAYTTIDKPTDYFNTVLYTGNSTDNTQITVGFQPDLVWIKRRNQAANHNLFDSVRGATKIIKSNLTNAETTLTDSLKSFDSNGFTLGDDATVGEVNPITYLMCSWNWKAGGTASSNTDGSITSSVSANTTAGFSIVKFNTNGQSSSSTVTCGHALNAVPKMIILKPLVTDNWYVYHVGIGNAKYINLDTTSAETSNSNTWGSTTPTSSLFSINTTFWGVNTNDIIGYCFAEKKGYSKFGSYTGNGNADGTFVYTGFKPAFVLLKQTNSTNYWNIYDNKRDIDNAVGKRLHPNRSDAETSNTDMDFLSNGFKLRNSGANQNGSGSTYIYMAFAENPFVTSTGIPTTAR